MAESASQGKSQTPVVIALIVVIVICLGVVFGMVKKNRASGDQDTALNDPMQTIQTDEGAAR